MVFSKCLCIHFKALEVNNLVRSFEKCRKHNYLQFLFQLQTWFQPSLHWSERNLQTDLAVLYFDANCQNVIFIKFLVIVLLQHTALYNSYYLFFKFIIFISQLCFPSLFLLNIYFLFVYLYKSYTGWCSEQTRFYAIGLSISFSSVHFLVICFLIDQCIYLFIENKTRASLLY